MGPRGSRTDLEANRNDRKRAESQKPLWYSGITLQEMLQILLAPEKGIVFIWLHMSLDCTVTPQGPKGTNFVTKIFNFRCFLPPATKTSFTTPLYYLKYEVWEIKVFCGKIPLNTATRGAATTIHALSKSTSARALHNDHHQCTHNIQEEDQD